MGLTKPVLARMLTAAEGGRHKELALLVWSARLATGFALATLAGLPADGWEHTPRWSGNHRGVVSERI